MDTFTSFITIIFFLISIAIIIVPGWLIASRAGFPGVLSLLLLIPVINIILLWVFAFIKWPIEKSNA